MPNLEYDVVIAQFPDILVEQVNIQLSEGWSLYGGLVVYSAAGSTSYHHNLLAQAMTRPKPTEPTEGNTVTP